MQLSPSDIKKLQKGIIPDKIGKKPFIVIRHLVKFIIGDNHTWEYIIATEENTTKETTVDRKTAMRIIEAFNMDIAHTEDCGQIYEMPGKPFMKQHVKKMKAAARRKKTAGTTVKTAAATS